MSTRALRPLVLLATLLPFLVAPASCVPATWTYRVLPLDLESELRAESTATSPVLAELDLTELTNRIEGFDRTEFAIYHGGRRPSPVHLEDRDGDGQPDLALVPVEFGSDARTLELIVTSPGPADARSNLVDTPLDTSAPRILPDYDALRDR